MSTTPQAVVDQLLRMNPHLATKKAPKKTKKEDEEGDQDTPAPNQSETLHGRFV
jgi:hypothetical protein